MQIGNSGRLNSEMASNCTCYTLYVSRMCAWTRLLLRQDLPESPKLPPAWRPSILSH